MSSKDMGEAVLDVRNVSFRYGSDRDVRLALADVSFEIARGAIVGLLGPNGSGKTTLLKLLSGVLRPRSGSVRLFGTSIDVLSRRALARRVAVVPQETHPTFDYTVLELVLMGRYPHLGPFELEGEADVAIARAALDATGTTIFEHRRFATLSGGEQQRVVIAAALAQASDLLLLDEPTTALDLRYQLEILSVLKRLNSERGTTLVVSTHDLNMAAAICDSVILLKGGNVIARGATADTLTVAHISALYDVDADVSYHTGAGHLTVVPLAVRH
jgi:iron complex transport system ATP-binding protein